MRCPAHNLVVPPGGECVLCRRGQNKPASALPGRVGLVALVLVATGLVGAIAIKLVSSAVERPSPELPAASASLQTPRTAKSEVVTAPTRPTAEAQGWGEPAPSPGSPLAVAEPAGAEDAGAIEQPAANDQPSEADLRAALRSVKVTLYSTNWCPHCTRARRWLQHNSIAFTEHDVEKSPAAKREHRRLVPGGGVPTLDIDGIVLTGFNEKRVGRAIARATQRRLEDSAQGSRER